MKYICTCLAVSDIAVSKKFYEDLFGLKVFQNYGKNISFTCSLALQEDFAWLVNLPKKKVLKKSCNAEIVFEERDFDVFLQKLKARGDINFLGGVVEHSWGQRVVRFFDPDWHLVEVGEEMKTVVRRFLDSGMTMEEVSARMDVSASDLETLLNAKE